MITLLSSARRRGASMRMGAFLSLRRRRDALLLPFARCLLLLPAIFCCCYFCCCFCCYLLLYLLPFCAFWPCMWHAARLAALPPAPYLCFAFCALLHLHWCMLYTPAHFAFCCALPALPARMLRTAGLPCPRLAAHLLPGRGRGMVGNRSWLGWFWMDQS